jgi:hypothetical protein
MAAAMKMQDLARGERGNMAVLSGSLVSSGSLLLLLDTALCKAVEAARIKGALGSALCNKDVDTLASRLVIEVDACAAPRPTNMELRKQLYRIEEVHPMSCPIDKEDDDSVLMVPVGYLVIVRCFLRPWFFPVWFVTKHFLFF